MKQVKDVPKVYVGAPCDKCRYLGGTHCLAPDRRIASKEDYPDDCPWWGLSIFERIELR